jgi:D-hexose-6-phosphate mutarotase
MTFGRAPQADKPARGAARIRENKVRRTARKAKGG